MSETYRTTGIILGRTGFREHDLRVSVLTADRGKLLLVARGGKKLRSKLAAHLEPFSLTEIMAVRGKTYDYAGAAVSQRCHVSLKTDFDKIAATGRVLGMIDRAVKEGSADAGLFELVEEFLREMDEPLATGMPNLLADLALLKFINKAGYRPQLRECVICKEKLKPGGNRFDLNRNGAAHSSCTSGKLTLEMSDDCVKVLRLADEQSLSRLTKLKISNKLQCEIKKFVESSIGYHIL
jgi:DNA repair protein RecO (recombination protein O)